MADLPDERITLRRGRIVNRPLDRLTVHRLVADDSGQRGRGAEIVIVADQTETRVTIDVGNTFSLRDEVWRLEEIEVSDDFAATIRRVR